MKSFAISLCTIVFITLAANAEQITLKNGDKITGSVEKSDGKTLLFKTDYAGELSIKWEDVQELSSDKKLYIATPDKKVISGTVTTQDSDLVVTTAQGAVHVPKASAGLIRSESEQADSDASLHPAFRRNWAGGLNLGFALARGNSATKNLDLAFNAIRPTLNDKLTLYATSVYSTNDLAGANPKTVANSILGGLRYDRNIAPRLFVYGTGDFQTDDLQHLDLRSIVGGGLGFHAIKTESTLLDFLGGADYTRETYAAYTLNPNTPNFVFEPSKTSSFLGASIGDDFSHKLGKASLLTQRFNYLPNLNNGGGYRTALDAGLTTKLNTWLGWQLGFSDRYTSNARPGNKNNDVLFTTGLALTFKH
jgi:putative salt-induced outer membrane protein